MSKPHPLPSLERLNELFRYDPDTGHLYRQSNDTQVRGKVGAGYLSVSIKHGLGYRSLRVHRIIWKMMTGKDPEGVVDHINHIRDDNRWKNLRDITQEENLRNARLSSNNTSGISGVSLHTTNGTYQVVIQIDGKPKYFGSFTDFEAAVERRNEVYRDHGFHESHGVMSYAKAV